VCANPAIRNRADEDEESSSVHKALAAVIALVDAQIEDDSYTQPAGSAEELLLDTELGGSRYLLLRMSCSQTARIHLSPRELEIVRMVAKGHPNKVIADVLSISSWTVCTHLRRIFAKLGVGSRAAMVAQLSETGALGSNIRIATEIRPLRVR
jgi:DNA-binding CsgD family transcriptional regulator